MELIKPSNGDRGFTWMLKDSGRNPLGIVEAFLWYRLVKSIFL